MNPILQRLWLWLIIIALCTSGCTRIFENNHDSQARQALQDLMAIQDQFHREHKRYAKNLLEIQKYNLKYHNGIVYLEIESAGKNKYRAISLPAESITARVFAYDTSKGGYYEMGEEEVGQYVLGALNHIRKEQRDKDIFDYLSAGMLVCLFLFGARMLIRYKESRTSWVWWPYFLSLAPLALGMATLIHMDVDIALSTELANVMSVGLGMSILCLILASIGFTKIPAKGEYHILQGIAVCTILISLASGAIVTQSYFLFSKPKTNTLYFK
jgi:hypothetical protein